MRSIPAWAGEPIKWTLATNLLAVYPRVGGGTEDMAHRTIPAWAGEP